MADLEKLNSKVLKLLSYRPRSIDEITRRLKRLTDSASAISTVIDQFQQQGLLNDLSFAQWWVDQRSCHRPKGRLALTAELRQKGVDQQLIDSVLPSFQQEMVLARQLVNKYASLPLIKIISRLKTRGFTSQTLAVIIDEIKAKE